MQTTLYFFRHGAYENPKQILHLRLPGFPLSKEGREQAQKLTEYFQKIPLTVIYSSPLLRTKQTAEIIIHDHQLKMQFDDRLLDVKSPLQGYPLTYLRQINSNYYQQKYYFQGGETLEDICLRMRSIVEEILFKHKGGHILIVSHGDPLMILRTHYRSIPLNFENIKADYLPIAGGFRVVFDNGKPPVVSAFP